MVQSAYRGRARDATALDIASSVWHASASQVSTYRSARDQTSWEWPMTLGTPTSLATGAPRKVGLVVQ